jgi:hypothetical protein
MNTTFASAPRSNPSLFSNFANASSVMKKSAYAKDCAPASRPKETAFEV